MNEIYFQAGAPLPASSSVYIFRAADEKTATHLHRMDYITFVEPRQHGKTSLINQLIGRFSSQGYAFAGRDLMAAKVSLVSSAEWYHSLGEKLLQQLHFIAQEHQPELPMNSATWENFLAKVAKSAETVSKKVVIVLDEIGAMPTDLATNFFSIIRSIYTSRENFSYWKYLTFIMAGAFNPIELIKDKTVSTFNVDHRIPLEDFNLKQITQLVNHLRLPEDLTQAIVERLHRWTDGQPYLCHRLCHYLEEQTPRINVADVDRAVERFFQEDLNHLVRIKDLAANPDLLTYTRSITSEPGSRFSPALNDKHFHLAHINGVIKASPDGLCRIRNRIYERALNDVTVPQITSDDPEPISQPKKKKFDPYAELKRNLKNGNVVAFVGAGLSMGAGLPGWYELISELALLISYELPPAQWVNGDMLIDAAQAYVNERGLNSLNVFLKEKLDTTGKSPTAAHLALAHLNISLIFTANFDNLLELAYREVRKRSNLVIKDDDISSMSKDANVVNIIKLYGDLSQPDMIVLTRQQYERFFMQRLQMIRLLETDLSRSDVLYLGWSHSDPHFNLILGELVTSYGEFKRTAYAVLFDVNEARRKELERKHIRLVELPAKGDRTEQIAAWLKSLNSDDDITD